MYPLTPYWALAPGLQATVLGIANAAQNLGAFSATLIWAGISHAVGLRAAFVVAALLFCVVSLPLLLELRQLPAVLAAIPALLVRWRASMRRSYRQLRSCSCCGIGRSRLLSAHGPQSDAPQLANS